jgi:hypothetical protein
MGESKSNKSKNRKHKRYTLRGISSLLNLDAFSAKRKKLLYQSLQGTSHVRILKSRTRRIEYKQHYSHCQKKKRADELQEKQSLVLPFSDALKEEQSPSS